MPRREALPAGRKHRSTLAFGGEGTEVPLDKLGGVAWQARKAKLKKRLLDMAGHLIRIAAERLTRHATVLAAPDGVYDEFAARFPYDETDDQLTAIEAFARIWVQASQWIVSSAAMSASARRK